MSAVGERPLNEDDKLSSIDLELLEEAFDLIDIAVDRQTKSHRLQIIWREMHDLLEHNGIDK